MILEVKGSLEMFLAWGFCVSKLEFVELSKKWIGKLVGFVEHRVSRL